MVNDEKSPADALNPIFTLVDDKDSEILDLKNSFLDDDAIVDNVILSKEIADDLDTNKFQLLYIVDEMYYLIHYADTGAISIVNTYAVDETPETLSPETNLFKLIASDIDKIINKAGISTTVTDEMITDLVNRLVSNIIDFMESADKSELLELLKDSDDIIKDILNKYSIKISAKVSSKIESKILKALANDKEPGAKLLANYLNYNGSFFLEYETRKRYMKVDKGFKEVDIADISEFFNVEFGYNEISANKSKQVLGFITRKIERDYNLIQFKNGTLNTLDETFKSGEFIVDRLPKLVVPFNYTPNAESEFEKTDLYSENHKILKSNRWDWNEDLFYECVGACGMAINEIDKLIVIVGEPGSRKSTILAILKRIFNYSEVKWQTIAENPRFQLLPTIARDINIDDDMQNFRIEKIGFLNTFVSGNGGEIEIKGENVGAKLTAETTPIIVGASNTLPSISGDGFERRLILILAENTFTASESKKSYMQDILSGERDAEIGLMFSYALQQYFIKRDTAIIDDHQKKAMNDEWEWKSYPAKKGAELMFIDEFTLKDRLDELIDDNIVESYKEISKWQIQVKLKSDECIEKYNSQYLLIDTYVPVKKVNQKFKLFYKYAYEKKKIFKESKKASTRVIKSAMENAGFYQTGRTYYDSETERTLNERVYEDCIDIESAIGFGDWKELI